MAEGVERIIEMVNRLPLIQRLQVIQQLSAGIERELQKSAVSGGEKTGRVLLPTDDLTYRILGCAMTVHRHKGSGYREDTYQRDLAVKFAAEEMPYAAQKLLEVFDSVDGRKLIGYYIPDFIVAQRVVVEIKALRGLDDSHVAQLIGYLAVTGYEVGLLINFGQRSLEWQRILPPERIQEHKVNRQWLFVPEWLQEG